MFHDKSINFCLCNYNYVITSNLERMQKNHICNQYRSYYSGFDSFFQYPEYLICLILKLYFGNDENS